MLFPKEITEKAEELAAAYNIKELSESAESMSVRYRGGSEQRSARGMKEIIAYALVRMPAAFAANCKALELTLESFNGEINSVLDIGAGTGAASCGAAFITGAEHITCIERDPNMILVGKELLKAADINAEWIKGDIAKLNEFPKSDLVVCSYCLNEIEENSRLTLLKKLWDSSEKLLIITEPGTPSSFGGVSVFRKSLIDLGAHIAAPCPNIKDCPIGTGDWCHFSCRAARTYLHKRLKKGDAPFEDEKFCFIAASKTPVMPCKFRVLRHPYVAKGRISLKICGSNGSEEINVVKKSHLWSFARKASSGSAYFEEKSD